MNFGAFARLSTPEFNNKKMDFYRFKTFLQKNKKTREACRKIPHKKYLKHLVFKFL